MDNCYDVMVVGGGFYGIMLALAQAQRGHKVVVIEQGSDILQGASYTNQARVHHGYHYPRCQRTAAAAALAYRQFCQAFAPAIIRNFVHAYAIARQGSKITANQFYNICQHHHIPIQLASAELTQLFTPGAIEQVFLVEEAAFCANTLRTLLREQLHQANVTLRLDTQVLRCSGPLGANQSWRLVCAGAQQVIYGQTLLLCTYHRINELLGASNLPCLALKHELCELLLLKPPPALKHVGMTVMDGPFFSLMPFPAEHCHSLSHVRWTPQHTWWEDEDHPAPIHVPASQSQATAILNDCRKFLPLLSKCEPIRSMYAIKTILPSQEDSDGRAILWQSFAQAPNLYAILGAKLDNIYDAIAMLPLTKWHAAKQPPFSHPTTSSVP